jgi:protein-S-isoprenylcysteine O-methyltransferase Ste14
MDTQTRKAMVEFERGNGRELLPLYGSMIAGYAGLVFTAVGIDRLVARMPGTSVPVALLLATAGAALVLYAARRMARWYRETGESAGSVAVKSGGTPLRANPAAVLRGFPGLATK